MKKIHPRLACGLILIIEELFWVALEKISGLPLYQKYFEIRMIIIVPILFGLFFYFNKKYKDDSTDEDS